MARLIGVGDNVVDVNYTSGKIFPGGNSLNFAVAGSELGHETAYLGKIARDSWGAMLLDVLSEKGVDCSRCVIEDGQTGRCGIHLHQGERTIEDENDGGLVKTSPLVLTEELLDYIASFDLAHSGCSSYLERELPKIRSRGVPVLYDFSDTWDEDRLRKICGEIDIPFLSGRKYSKAEMEDVLACCVDDYGCRLAVSTMGGRGAIVYNGRRHYSNSPYNFAGGAVDTTGAGDSWIAAFIGTYLDGMRICERIRAEASPDFVRPCDLEDFEDRVISHSMAVGNLLARRCCLREGSFGFGVRGAAAAGEDGRS